VSRKDPPTDAGEYIAPDEQDPNTRLAEVEATLARVLLYLDPKQTSRVLYPLPVGERPEVVL
jgi:hypothetical protein